METISALVFGPKIKASGFDTTPAVIQSLDMVLQLSYQKRPP